MILFTFENDKNTAIKTEVYTSAREQLTCSDGILTCPMEAKVVNFISSTTLLSHQMSLVRKNTTRQKTLADCASTLTTELLGHMVGL